MRLIQAGISSRRLGRPNRATIAALVLLLAAALVVVDGRASLGGPCRPFRDVRVIGSVGNASLDEISGIVMGRAASNVLWAEEDSGNAASIYALSPTGAVLTSIALTGASNVDWEDIARARGRIWVADIGDNARARASVRVYWFDQPATTSITSVSPESATLHYPGGARDAEAMIVDGTYGLLYIFEKQHDTGTSHVYRADLDALTDGADVTLTDVGTVPLAQITAADIGPTGIVIANYEATWFFPSAGSRRVRAILDATPCRVALAGSESVAFSISGNRIYSIPEGANANIREAFAAAG